MRWLMRDKVPTHPRLESLLLFRSLLSPHDLSSMASICGSLVQLQEVGECPSSSFWTVAGENGCFSQDDQPWILNLCQHSAKLGRDDDHAIERLGTMSGFIGECINMYSYIVLASVLVSWVQLPPDNPIVQILDTFTEPLLGPIRKVMPDMGGLDFSPIVLFFLLNMLAEAI